MFYYTLRSPNGSFWFQTKAPITAKGEFKVAKGSKLFGSPVETAVFDPTAPLGCWITAKNQAGTSLMWLLDSSLLDDAGDHKTEVGLTGTLSITIKP